MSKNDPSIIKTIDYRVGIDPISHIFCMFIKLFLKTIILRITDCQEIIKTNYEVILILKTEVCITTEDF